MRNVKQSWDEGNAEAGFRNGNLVHRLVKKFPNRDKLAHGRDSKLADWIWVDLLQKEVDDYVAQFNDHKVRYQAEKVGPSGASPDYAFEHPEEFGGENQLIEVDIGVINVLLQNHPGEVATRFYSPRVNDIATAIYVGVGSPAITFESAWEVFALMIDEFWNQVAPLDDNGKYCIIPDWHCVLT